MQSYAESGRVVLKVPHEGRVTSLHIARVEQLAPCDAAGILDGSSDLTGLMLWPAAEALAHLIATEPDKWRGKTVLELGAGVGLVGLVASLFCGQVLITDGEEEVISMIEENLQANKDALPEASRVRCCSLDWTEDLDAWKAKHDCSSFDVIVGSDIIYSFEALPALFTVVQGLLAHTADAHFLVLYSSRGKRLDDRLPEVAAAHGFDCSVAMHLPPHATTAPPSASDDQSPDEPMRLCTFTRKTRA
ncbi:nicotinamide n-methyltransferase [Acanthamoeba castellanii str. Neff]|uniref:Nicotinamide n-methyltransferase n=1 Tax=Acanthamoeba castellanii (strain ATCC 30010 / Neff) TaxID=1257118 RepID=L8GF92_ACACF|nr:nicotinamide n-methyltransferase [Acanthamoeba castellanii str. Neff]ELR11534.1 nicotinamide n-methyltransferase [Acanthamoeba castellanii str. Neff]